MKRKNEEKTILFPESFGEYTSWYQDNDFVGQYGVETSSLKPMGKNPQDDFNSVAANTLQLIRTHVINVFGAMARLIVGIDNVRRLRNIKNSRGINAKENISNNVIFLSDGGINPWVIHTNIINAKERERLRLEALRIEITRDHNRLLQHLGVLAQNLLEAITQNRAFFSLPSTDILPDTD